MKFGNGFGGGIPPGIKYAKQTVKIALGIVYVISTASGRKNQKI